MAFIHGIHVPHRKNTQDKDAIRIPTPATVTIPTSMHIGAPAEITVKAGDEVKVGTLLAKAASGLSSPVHSSVSGKVSKITDYLLMNGSKAKAVVIESDGEMTPDESIKAPKINSKEDLISALKESGIVGLGGAGFPTYAKLNVDADRIEELIINGAECEPYVTSDSYTMLNRQEDMKDGLCVLCRHLGIKKVIIGVEANKKNAIKSMQEFAAECDFTSVSVKVLPAVYPQGGEKVLIFNTTKKVVPTGKLPIDVGCVVLNCTTLAAIGAYIKTGMPLVKKCVTIDGGAVKEPKVVIAPIGTSLSELFDFCGGLKEEPSKIIYGGPMMGISVTDATLPVIKNTNAVLALTEKETALPKTTACIRCGACANTCPFSLSPVLIAKAYENKDKDSLTKLSVNTCMECGCCSYTCPANRPLVQTNKLAKIFLREEMAKEGEKK